MAPPPEPTQLNKEVKNVSTCTTDENGWYASEACDNLKLLDQGQIRYNRKGTRLSHTQAGLLHSLVQSISGDIKQTESKKNGSRKLSGNRGQKLKFTT